MLAIVLLAISTVGFISEAPEATSPDSDSTYWAYVGAESADLIHRVRFHPTEGATVEKTTPVGELFNKIEGPHGLAIDEAGEHLYMTTAHGYPDGKLWKYHLGPDTLAADPILLGRFPATVDVTPDGDYAFVVNFNQHGDPIPSSVSVVYTPEMKEIARTTVGVMPHGSRITTDGTRQYTGIMMEDDVVEIDTRTYEESRRFNVAAGEEGPADPAPYADHRDQAPHDTPASASGDPAVTMQDVSQETGHGNHAPTCSPTWVQPSATGEDIYVACNASDRVHEIDAQEWALSRTFETGAGPYNIEVTPNNEILIVTLDEDDGVEFIDRASGETLAQVETSTTVPHGAVATPDSRYAFVTVEGVGSEPGKVDVYDLTSFERVGSVEVGQQASGIDFWKMEPSE